MSGACKIWPHKKLICGLGTILGGLKFRRILLYNRMNASLRRSTYIVLFLVEDDFIEVQCGWHLRHLKWHLRRHLVKGDEDAAGDEDAG